MTATEHAHAYRPVGYCQHPHERGVNEHRVYRCECGAYAHSRTPVTRVCGRSAPRDQRWWPARCPVSMQQSEVEAWQQQNRERAGVRG